MDDWVRVAPVGNRRICSAQKSLCRIWSQRSPCCSASIREQVESWISTGPNRPVAPQELERALGEGETDRLASEAGTERPGLLAVLSQMLPRLIDGLTPQGRLPTQGEMPEGGLGGMLRQILGHLGGEPSAGTHQAGVQASANAESTRKFGESPPAAGGRSDPGR